MAKLKATKEYIKYSDDLFCTTANNVIKAMKTHEVFENFIPEADLLATIILEFEEILPLAKRMDSIAVDKKNKLREQAVPHLSKLCDDVNGLAQGDEEIIKLSGFPYTQFGKDAAVALKSIENFKFLYTNMKGVFNVKSKRQTSAYQVALLYSFEDPRGQSSPNWLRKVSNKFNFKVDLGVTTGKVYVKLVFFGKKGDVVETETIEVPIYAVS